jgi:hypothetical protein
MIRQLFTAVGGIKDRFVTTVVIAGALVLAGVQWQVRAGEQSGLM